MDNQRTPNATNSETRFHIDLVLRNETALEISKTLFPYKVLIQVIIKTNEALNHNYSLNTMFRNVVSNGIGIWMEQAKLFWSVKLENRSAAAGNTHMISQEILVWQKHAYICG